MNFSGGHYPYLGDDPAGVELARSELGRVGGTFGTLAGEVEDDTRSIQAHWPRGQTGRLAAADAARMGGALEECHQAFARAERALSVLHPVLVAGRRKVDELNRAFVLLAAQEDSFEAWRAAGFRNLASSQQLFVTEETIRVAQARAGYDSLADVDRAHARVESQVTAETAVCDELLSRLAGQASGMPGHAAGRSRYDVSFGLLWAANQVADILDGRVRFPSDPQGVRDAWMRLSPDQRAELLHARPLWFGNLNGIPAADRSIANVATLDAQLSRLAVGLAIAGIGPTADPKDLEGLDPTQLGLMEAFSGLTVREAKQALLLKIQLDANGESGAQLLAYEPGVYGGQGRAAIVYGNLDRADNVAVCVPGLMSSLDNMSNIAGDALNLYGQAISAAPGLRTAVVAWQGYDAPNWLQVGFQGSAERGAKLLAADVSAMRTTHDGAIGTLTVVGHSYGSTTTGLALQHENLTVDQVALIGSPGVGGDARTVADLHLKRSQLFVGSASQDLVTSLPSVLGADPSQLSFEGTRIKAESVNRGGFANIDDHSLYYDALNHSESLYALADIVTGHGDRLGHDGMLAQPRQTQIILTRSGVTEVPWDPEASRIPTAGHDHANDIAYELRTPGP